MRTGTRLRAAPAIVAALVAAGLFHSSLTGQSVYRKAANRAAAWLDSASVKTDQGLVWPVDPADPARIETSLYAGVPGVVLFHLELHRAGDKTALAKARDGARYLLARWPEMKSSGLYTGIAGIGFTLNETYKASRDESFRKGAIAVTEAIAARARRHADGVDWSDTTDIVDGTAGIGLFLLYSAREMSLPAARELAIAAGSRLIELARPAEEGLNWAMNPTFPRDMPNFSHGTAGVAYFLASLYRDTQKRQFLAAAEAGAHHLLAIARTEGETCAIRHHTPGGEDLFYLGWCHGPAGTARVFYRLHQATGNPKWMTWVNRSAKTILDSGIPEKQTPGFWNNAGACCGSAGVADFFLSLSRITGNQEYARFAKRVTDNLLARGTAEGAGLKWIHAEHRAQPENRQAQTGLMQGAAGIGMWLLRLDAKPATAGITLPDSPF